GSRGSFAVADALCDRRPAEALRLLRGVLEAGHDPVMVLGALAYRLRCIVAVAGGVDPSSVGLNLSAAQARRLQTVRRSFGPGQVTRAYRALADADLAIKSGDLPPAFVLERAVAAIATRP
ncbi:MAG: DNA polymerase III subunit delta, partial [Actinomycetota bacterium]|nr:DNA polymerase III subunit delta [Actinomycetota bacterium]